MSGGLVAILMSQSIGLEENGTTLKPWKPYDRQQ